MSDQINPKLGLAHIEALSRGTHKEHQPHKWALALTAKRTWTDIDGGDFYLSEYGIHVRSSADTVVGWQPLHAHGTSVQNYFPNSPILSGQTGLAIVTSNRLDKVWKKYQAGIISAKEAEKEYAEGGGEDEILGEHSGTNKQDPKKLKCSRSGRKIRPSYKLRQD